MSTNPNDPRRQIETTYFADRSNQEEMTRLAIQDEFATRGMGGTLPEQPHPLLFQRILDVGSGTGGWLIEMAKTYPSITKLVGVDANSHMVEYARTQARAAQVDDRVEFRVMDALLLLEFPPSSFDLVNMRFAVGFIRTWDWPKLLSEMRRVTRPEGVIRLTEIERITSSHQAPLRLLALIGKAFFRAGHLFSEAQTTDTFSHGTIGVADDLARLLDRHEIHNVQTRRSTQEFLPSAPAGQSFALDLRLGFRTTIPFMKKWVGLPDTYEQMYQEMLDAMQEPDYVASWNLLTAWGYR